MAKKNKNSNKILNIFLEKIKTESFKLFFGWFLIIFGTLVFISFLSDGGILTSKIKNFSLDLFGWSSYFLSIILVFLGYLFLKKPSWLQIFKYFLALLFLFFVFNFYFHLIFREGGRVGEFIFNFSKFIGKLGLFIFSIVFTFFSLWLLFEERLFQFLKLIFQKSERFVEETKKVVETKIVKPSALKTVKKEIPLEIKKQAKMSKKIIPSGPWKLPPLDLLPQVKEEVVAPDIKQTSETIKKTLENFGISSEIVEVEIGPAVTRFSLKPGEGVKLSKILSLQNDIALALGVPNLYIETPVPGKAVIGIEVPNLKLATVRLGNVLREKEFLESSSLLLFPIGRKINGEVIFADLSKMPHLLIAGTTGSGKSIFIHSILISFLMKNTPETLNLALVDPKRVELSAYYGLPHLALEPITQPKQALSLFNWLVTEMEERYKILESASCRDIDSYNRKQIKSKNKILPRIVLVIDELADLMVAYGSSLETMIIRLSQMARATGIHLILATQRPSVDIVTGLIKANIPNRVCFKVASNVDSRTVLDMGGAEKLTGQGDGLFVSSLSHKPLRIKAPFVSEKEIENIGEFWRNQIDKVPKFEKEKINLDEIEKKMISIDEAEDEELLNEAIKIVISTGKASTSLLQRRLKIGYARAARLLDLMEEKGIVGPQEGSKPRKVLVDETYFEYSNKNGAAKQIEE